ncbi:MAG: hypothetical protein ABT20_18705 [Rubrivivax sp. SCN 70-15]|nr:MAG: hypothetical protein ABT20_18705 [Rubrivivax sp. SCN 70-15]
MEPAMIDVLFLVLPDTLLLDLAGPAEAFRLANQALARRGQGPAFRLRYVGPQAEAATSVGATLAAVEPLPAGLERPTWLVLLGQPSGNTRSRKCGRASRSPYSTTKSRNAAPWRAMPNENMVRPAISRVMRCITSRRSTGPSRRASRSAMVSSIAETMCGTSVVTARGVKAGASVRR